MSHKYNHCWNHLTTYKLIRKLRNMGNHIPNTDVLTSGVGELVVAYRQAETEPNSMSHVKAAWLICARVSSNDTNVLLRENLLEMDCNGRIAERRKIRNRLLEYIIP